MPGTLARAALAGAASVLVVLGASCARSDEGTTPGATPATTTGSASAAPSAAAGDHTEADVMFSTMMVPHHLQAVEMADLVPGRSTDPEVGALAERIRTAQQGEVARMTSWLTAWGASPAIGHEDHEDHGGADAMMSPDDLRALATLEGPAFDRRWLELMVVHHEGAVEMADAVLRDGRHGPTRSLATSVLEQQRAEIEQMRVMLGG